MHSPLKVAMALSLVAGLAHAYPNGTPHYVTDLVPACASCHSVLDPATLPELPPDRASGELAVNKHLGAIKGGAFPLYSELTDEQKDTLVAQVQALDREAQIELSGPASAAPGAPVEVKVAYRGGNGPVVGVMLVDRPLRHQARPIQSGGWWIEAVTARTSLGGDASEWFGARTDGAKNLNFVLLPAPRPAGEPAPSGTVIFRLQAPAAPGPHPLTAVLLYGTENTDRAGFFQRPSGRILFSKPLTVTVP